jgi:membrane protease YdiL (CAAX protease family)
LHILLLMMTNVSNAIAHTPALAGLATYCQPLFSRLRLALWGTTVVGVAWAASFSPAAAGPTVWLLAGAPLVEETVFRSGLQTALMQRGVPAATACVALAFAAAHALQHPWTLAVLTALPALAIGWVYARTRRLSDCVALHALCNAVWLLGADTVAGGLA